MAYLFTYTHPDKSNLDPAEFVGLVNIDDPDKAMDKIKESMPGKLKELGYKIGLNNLEDHKNWCFIVANNTPILLDDFCKNRFVREFLDSKAE